MRAPSMWQLIVILVVIVLLFGWKRLPDMARSVGRSMRIFKSEIEQMAGDDTKDDTKDEDKDREPRSDSTPERPDDRSTSSTALEGRVTDDPQPDTRPRD